MKTKNESKNESKIKKNNEGIFKNKLEMKGRTIKK
jgi:hypothetical protein